MKGSHRIGAQKPVYLISGREQDVHWENVKHSG
jgi:hypothetical protein